MKRKQTRTKANGDRHHRARGRRVTGRRSRGGLVPKPKTREAQIKWAETLGMDELGWVHGAQGCPANGCCCWHPVANVCGARRGC